MVRRGRQPVSYTHLDVYKRQRLARTIADLAGAGRISAEHLAEAVALRVLDRGGAADA